MMPDFPLPALVRIDFVCFEPYGLTVDGRAGPGSFPFAIRVPYRRWALMAASTLCRWAATNETVRLEFRHGRDGLRARFSDGLRLVVLDLGSTPPPPISEVLGSPRFEAGVRPLSGNHRNVPITSAKKAVIDNPSRARVVAGSAR